MKTVGEILKTARENKEISLEKAAAATKIKKKFLSEIEDNYFKNFPSSVALRGFVKNYAEFLGLSSSSVLAVFKRDYGGCQKNDVVVRGVGISSRSGFSWSPRLTLAVVIGAAFLILSSYLGYQYFSLVSSPRLEVVSPQDGQETLEQKIEIIGKVDPDSTVAINGELASVKEGDFSSTVALLPGENKVVIEAENKMGKKTTLVRTLHYIESGH